MSNDLVVPVIPFISESPAAAHHAHHHSTAKETKPAAEVPYAPKVFKGAGHEKIEKELARTLNQLPYMENAMPAKGKKSTAVEANTRPLWKKATSAGVGAVISIFSPIPTPLGLSITAASTTYKYARNAEGIKATQAAFKVVEEASSGGTFSHNQNNNKPPEPMALMGRTRLLRSRQGNQIRIKSEITFPIDPPENQPADAGSHVLKVTASSSTNGSGQSR